MFNNKIKCPQCSENIFGGINCTECPTRTCEKCRTQFHWSDTLDKLVCCHDPTCNIFNIPDEEEVILFRSGKRLRTLSPEI